MIERKKTFSKIVLIVFIILLIIYLFPYLWLILTSFKTRLDTFSIPPKIFFEPTLNNYKEAFIDKNFIKNFQNSLIVTFFVTTISMLVGIPSAYAFSRFNLKGGNVFFFYMLATRFIPFIILALPFYFVMARLKLLNTYYGIVIGQMVFYIPFVIWMMKGFFDTIPKDIDDSARIDGCSWFRTLISVILPLSTPGLVATAIFCAVNTWNEFLVALILTGSKTETLPVAIPRLLTTQGTYWGQIAAVGSVITIPVLIFAFFAQKYMVEGILAGSIKQ